MSTAPSDGPPVLRLRTDAGAPAQPSADAATAAPAPFRVILVGRTGLDIALRTDPGIELIRAPTPIHAIGELSDPIDDSTPHAVSVVVGPDADPGERTREFADCLRLLAPDVRVLQAVDGPNAARWPEYHDIIDTRRPAEELRQLVRGVEPAATPSSRPEPKADPNKGTSVWRAASEILDLTDEEVGALALHADDGEPGSSSFKAGAAHASPSPPAAVHPDDHVMIAAILAGRDPIAPATEIIRRRLGGITPVFVPSGVTPEEPPAGTSALHVRVQHHGPDGAPLGELWAAGVDHAALRAQADWLAHWLTLNQQHEQLRRAAFTDDLTGAWNRRYFNQFLASALAHATQQRHGVTLLVFDIDDFKRYNDRYGHAAGDEILTETVRLLKSVIRPTDRVCRIGGDEFAVIFHEPTGPRDPGSKPPTSVSQIARRFQKQICEHRFPKLAEEAPGTLTISGGLATFPWDGRTAVELLQRADELATQSKRLGKNAITLGPGAAKVCGAEDPS